MRTPMPREFYIPKDASKHPTDAAAIFTYTTPKGKPAALAFLGKAQKPSWHYLFNSEEQREKRIAEQIQSCQMQAKAKAEWKAERSRPHTLTVGAILVSSWGYDQTNVDFYQVTRIVGPHMVEIRPIASRPEGSSEGFSSMSDHVVACPDQFTGGATRHKSNSTNSVRLSSYSTASPWSGRRQYRSWYA